MMFRMLHAVQSMYDTSYMCTNNDMTYAACLCVCLPVFFGRSPHPLPLPFPLFLKQVTIKFVFVASAECKLYQVFIAD